MVWGEKSHSPIWTERRGGERVTVAPRSAKPMVNSLRYFMVVRLPSPPLNVIHKKG
jgi:hypothetical protein